MPCRRLTLAPVQQKKQKVFCWEKWLRRPKRVLRCHSQINVRAVHKSTPVDFVGGCLVYGGDTPINNLINLMRAPTKWGKKLGGSLKPFSPNEVIDCLLLRWMRLTPQVELNVDYYMPIWIIWSVRTGAEQYSTFDECFVDKQVSFLAIKSSPPWIRAWVKLISLVKMLYSINYNSWYQIEESFLLFVNSVLF